MVNNTNMRIPKKYHKMIEQITYDSDGYWCTTEIGYYASGVDEASHVIHEYTREEVMEQIRDIKPCNCYNCINGI